MKINVALNVHADNPGNHSPPSTECRGAKAKIQSCKHNMYNIMRIENCTDTSHTLGQIRPHNAGVELKLGTTTPVGADVQAPQPDGPNFPNLNEREPKQ